MKNFKEKYQINKNIEEKSKDFREFKEFDQLRENEILVTIEYWY